MTSRATSSPNTCACGCGTPISQGAKWARGHFRRGEGTYAPMPAPNETVELSGLGDEFPGDLGGDFGEDAWRGGGGYGGPDFGGPDIGQDGELGDDPPPSSLRGDPGPRRTGSKVTAALRRDINAKVSLPLTIGGGIWKARDPVCGGTFYEGIPGTADAATDIICSSPDLIEFMTGPAGGFMIYLKLGAALWPTVEAILTHHVFGHGHGQRGGPAVEEQRDLSARYAA